MITLVFSPNQHLPKNMQHSVHKPLFLIRIVYFSPVGKNIAFYKSFAMFHDFFQCKTQGLTYCYSALVFVMPPSDKQFRRAPFKTMFFFSNVVVRQKTPFFVKMMHTILLYCCNNAFRFWCLTLYTSGKNCAQHIESKSILKEHSIKKTRLKVLRS